MTTAYEYAIATTVSYPQWLKNVKAGKYNPKDGSQTNWGKLLALLNPPAPTYEIKGMYNGDSGAAAGEWPTIYQETGCNMMIVAADDVKALGNLRATGSKAWCTIGFWDDDTGQFSESDVSALAVAKQAAATFSDVIVGWYVADEPSMGHANAPVTVAARSALLKTALNVPTIGAMWDTDIFANFKASLDAFALDGYPSRNGWNMSVITDQATAADNLGISYFGVVGAFTDGTTNYPLPTPAQLQQMFDTWKATKQLGWLVYVWGQSGAVEAQQLQNLPTLLEVIKANS